MGSGYLCTKSAHRVRVFCLHSFVVYFTMVSLDGYHDVLCRVAWRVVLFLDRAHGPSQAIDRPDPPPPGCGLPGKKTSHVEPTTNNRSLPAGSGKREAGSGQGGLRRLTEYHSDDDCLTPGMILYCTRS